MNNQVLKFSNVTKRFGHETAVDGLNLTLSKGRVMALIGPNGAGKTTSIRMIFDLLRPDSGSIEVNGLNPSRDFIAVRQRCGYVPERPQMIPWMTVRRIMDFVAPFYPSWNKDYAEKLRIQLNLGEHQKVKHLSRGEEARLALILGLAFQPELLVLDDATSGIDPAARRDILENIIRHIHETGTTILFATHLVHEVEGLADVAAFMINGKIRFCGLIDELKRRVKKIVVWSDHPLHPHPPGVSILKEHRDGRCTERIIDGFRREDWCKESGGLKDSEDLKIEVHDMSLEEIYLAFHDASQGGI